MRFSSETTTRNICKLIEVLDLEVLDYKVMTNKDRLNKLYSEYGLSEDDYFKHKFYTIITRSGIDKIQAKANKIKASMAPLSCMPPPPPHTHTE